MTEAPESIGRRKFLSRITWGISGLIGLVFGIPAIGYIVGPALKKQEENWLEMGSISKVELGNPTLFKKKIVQQIGWSTKEDEVNVYILSKDGHDYEALSNVCTHLACRVRWIAEEETFLCPCHNAGFDKNGDVLFGPPPKPLDRFEVKIENDKIFIKQG